MNTRVASCLGTVLMLFSLAESAWPASYTVTDLGTLGGVRSWASGINDSGQVVGWAENSSGSIHAFRTAANQTINLVTDDLGTLGGNESEASGINANGQVVGFSFTAANEEHAFLYDGGTIHDLGTAGQRSWAEAINKDGAIVGAVIAVSGDARAYLWGGTGDLGTYLPGTKSWANGINSSLVIACGSEGTGPAFVYDHGTKTSLGTLGGASSESGGINASGRVVGNSYFDTSGVYHAFLSTPPYVNPAPPPDNLVSDLGTLTGYPYSGANSINDFLQIVGSVATSPTAHGRAVLWSERTIPDPNSFIIQDLNSLIITPGWTLESAYSINNLGQIVGVGVNPSGQEHALRLDPTPEPSAFVLLVAGVVSLIIYVWRQKRRSQGTVVRVESTTADRPLTLVGTFERLVAPNGSA